MPCVSTYQHHSNGAEKQSTPRRPVGEIGMPAAVGRAWQPLSLMPLPRHRRPFGLDLPPGLACQLRRSKSRRRPVATVRWGRDVDERERSHVWIRKSRRVAAPARLAG